MGKKVFRLLRKSALVALFKCKHPRTKLFVTRAPTFYSQAGQDAFVATLLIKVLQLEDDDRWVVDIGANHPFYFSNSYFFEKWFSCRVVAIDPVNQYSHEWKKERPASDFFSCAVSSEEKDLVLQVPDNGDTMFATTFDASKINASREIKGIKVKARRVSSILDENSIKKVLYCSVDVGGAEYEVLQGFNFDDHQVLCFSIVNNKSGVLGSELLRRYMKSRGYCFVARFWGLDDIFVKNEMIPGGGVFGSE